MSTLGNSVGPIQCDTYDKAEVNSAIDAVSLAVAYKQSEMCQEVKIMLDIIQSKGIRYGIYRK